VQVRKEIVKLLIVECGTGHSAVSMEDYGTKAFIRGRRSRGHGLDLGDGLKTGAV
jgi:hypothetical protein